MNTLNDALDELRSVPPYAHGPSVRKLSKNADLGRLLNLSFKKRNDNSTEYFDSFWLVTFF